MLPGGSLIQVLELIEKLFHCVWGIGSAIEEPLLPETISNIYTDLCLVRSEKQNSLKLLNRGNNDIVQPLQSTVHILSFAVALDVFQEVHNDLILSYRER